MKNEFYIQRKPSSFLGNSPFWWGKNGNGYTAYIMGAERFSEEEATRMVKQNSDKWAMFKCEDIDRRLHLIFDFQDVKNLGTDNPCGWAGGYAAYFPFLPTTEGTNYYKMDLGAFNNEPKSAEVRATLFELREEVATLENKNAELASALKAVFALTGEDEQIEKIINDVLAECEL